VKVATGDKVLVKAWWDEPNNVWCEIRNVYHHYENDLYSGEKQLRWTLIDIQPLSGNPHMRSIRPDAIIRKEHESL